MSSHPLLTRFLPTILSLSILLCAFTTPTCAKTIQVSPGQKIQSAINSAHTGDTIDISRGIYQEQLLITTPGLSLVSHRAKLVAPATQNANNCSSLYSDPNIPPTHAGICVFGSGIEFSTSLSSGTYPVYKVLSVQEAIASISISGFEIAGFSGYGIAVVGGEKIRVRENKIVSTGIFGVLAVGSEDVLVSGNEITAAYLAAEAANAFTTAVGIADTSAIEVRDNTLSGSFQGIGIQASSSTIRDNKVRNVTNGIYLSENSTDIQVRDNSIRTPFVGDFQPSGVIVTGASNSTIQGNEIRGVDFGLSILDGAYRDWKGDIVQIVGNGILVKGNRFVSNVLDISNCSAGSNVIKGNKCKQPTCLIENCF